jgi:DNA-binding transcriptional MocR family regulator
MSASKAIAAGLRVGFVRAPSKGRQKMIEGLNASCLGIPPLMAELFAMWQEDGTIERTIARRRTETQARQNIALDMLKELTVTGHPASYHVWLELPEGWTGMKLMMEAQLRGVAVTPADAFSVEKKPPVEAVRLSIGVPPTRELLRTGLQIITDILQGLSDRKMPVV